MHASGERLGQLTGIAAILRFPMPDLDLADDHHHHETNNGNHHDDLQPNPNRPTDDDTNSDGNRAEASAW